MTGNLFLDLLILIPSSLVLLCSAAFVAVKTISRWQELERARAYDECRLERGKIDVERAKIDVEGARMVLDREKGMPKKPIVLDDAEEIRREREAKLREATRDMF